MREMGLLSEAKVLFLLLRHNVINVLSVVVAIIVGKIGCVEIVIIKS